MTDKNYFEVLQEVKCETEKKGSHNLTYISWAEAWKKTKELHPTADYEVHCAENGVPYFTDGKVAFVKVSVTIPVSDGDEIIGQSHTVMLPILNHMNKAIPPDQIESFSVNTSIQRCLTKAIAMHGLGLYVYRGEDLPVDSNKDPITEAKSDKELEAEEKEVNEGGVKCEDCSRKLTPKVQKYSMEFHKRHLCMDCQKKQK